jgi:autotransporter-associated beta strand protein
MHHYLRALFVLAVVLAGACIGQISALAFDHPSALHTQADFDRMKAKVQAGAHPWVDSWNILINNSSANLGYPTHPQGILQRGNGGGACLTADNYQFAYWDTAAAYQFALRWKGTGDNRYADAAINILNQWSSICTNLCGDPNIQLLEIYGYQFAVAGDIMRSYTNWAAADVQRFQVWMLNLWYPMDHGFLLQHMGACASHQWANWDLCSMNSMMAIGILCDDTNIYNEALTYFKNGLGAGNIEQTVYLMYPGYLGQGQEEGRDQGHSGMDMAMLGVFCTMAYNHGDDLFAYQNNRVLSMCEYFAEFNYGYDVPYTTYGNCDATPQTNLGGSSRGDNRPCWDLIYNHYVNLKGLAAPWSQLYAARVRPEGGGGNYGGNSGGYDQLGFTTLTCSLDPIVVGGDPSGLTANLNGQQQVILNWWGTGNATNYLVKRATTSGGPYTIIATNTANLVAYTDLGASKAITTNLLTYTDSDVTNGVTYYYTVSALTPLGESGNAIEQSVSLLPQLVAYYKFNESSGKNAADASGNGRTATLNSATFLSAGHSNNCVNMNGSMQFVTLPAGITTNLTDFTIATWVYLNGTQQWWSRLFDFGVGVTNSAGSPMRYMFLCPSAGNINFTISVGSNQTVPNNGATPAQTVSTSSGVLPINSWHHVAVTLAGTTCSIYVDGVLAGSGTITITPSQLGTTTQNCIGRSQWTSDPYLIGRVDDFRIYNGALNAAQLAALVAAYPVQPPAPTNVVATVASANEIDLTWSPADGATNYYVKRANVSGGPYTTISAPLTQTNFSDSSLIGGKTYYYVITAINDGGATNSAPVSATTLVAPPAPASLTATAVSSSQINLTWPASAGATSYNVRRAYFSGGAYTVIATNVAATGYTNTSLYNAVTYYYVVSAANANGVSTNSVESNATTQPLPATPSGVVATPGNLSVQLQWTAAANAASYNVKRSATSGSGYVMIASNVVTAGFLDTGLTNGATYYYVVSGVNAVGESANSAEVSATPTDLIDWWKFDETSGNLAADSGAAGKTGTLLSGATWIPGVINNAVHLDGTANGYVSFPSGLVSTLNDFSICCWVKADASATWARVFDFGSGTGTYMFLSPFNGSGVVRYAITTSSGAGEQGINSPSALSTGVWHHLAVTLSGSTGVLYIDGKAVGTNSSMTLNPSSLGGTTQNYLGKSQWNDPNLTGSVDDFHIYARALSSGEIAALATFIPPAPTGVAAIAGNASATLVWSASAGATSYNVKRSTTSGTNYVTVATVASPQWVDSGLVNGTPYYYVVSAVSVAGESANSAEASVTPSTGAATTLIWSGAVNGTWDTATANWVNSGAAATFADGNTAFFGDTGANATVNLSASRSPGNVIVNNSAVNYTIGGSAMAGTGKLLKQGSGMLTLSAANTYSGGTVISNGTIVCANSSALGAGPLTLAGGTLVNSSAGQISLANNLYAYGTNQVYLSVSQNIDLSGCSMYGNGTVTWGWSGAGWSGINLPVLNYMTGGSFIIPNTPNNFIRINSAGCGNANVDWIINENTVGHTTIGFTSGILSFGSLSGSGYLDNQNSAGNTLSIGGNNKSTTFAGSIVNGSGLSLTKVGAGTLSLTGVNSYTDGTTVNGGKLLITANSAVKGVYSVANGATLGVTNVSSSSALVSNLTMAAGSTLELQNISSTTTSLIAASNVTVNGSCAVKITGASGLVAGNSYPLISYAGTLSGPFANLQLQMPYGWRGVLVNSGNQITLANVAVISTTPPPMNLTVGSQQLQLFWPQANTGWRLQVQTNVVNAGLGTNWTDVPTAIGTNQIGVPISATNGCVFFRLVYP